MKNNKPIRYKIEITLNGFSNNDKSFHKYIDSLPKYYKRSPTKYERHIKEYLHKNRSARLFDIVNGCRDQGLKISAHYPSSIFFKNLQNLIESGHVTKTDKVYCWNYKE